ncbi:MAG: S8 family serine peptidase, partial [Acidimicrobiia bacterium]
MRHRGTIAAILMALMLAGPVRPAQAHHGSFPEYEPDQVVVKLDQVAAATIDDVNATWGTSTIDTLLASAGIYLLSVPSGTDPEDLAEEMESDVRLLYAEPNYHSYSPEFHSHTISAWSHTISAWSDLLTPQPSTDPAFYLDQYAVDLLGIDAAHDLARGAGVVVAVL